MPGDFGFFAGDAERFLVGDLDFLGEILRAIFFAFLADATFFVYLVLVFLTYLAGFLITFLATFLAGDFLVGDFFFVGDLLGFLYTALVICIYGSLRT